MRGIFLTMALASLAACGSNDGGGNSSAGSDVPSGAGQAQVPPALTVDNSQKAVPVTLPSPVPLSSIPAAFQGRWGMVPADCDPKRDDNKGLMTITADRLSFYESRATIGSLQQVTPTKIQGMLSYSGEGETWRKATSLTLEHAGKTLVREETDPVSADTYSKCPA